MTLLRAGASVVAMRSVRLRPPRPPNVEAMLGEDVDYRVEIRDVTEAIDERGLDRILLDMPEPWRVLPRPPSPFGPAASCSPTCRHQPDRGTSPGAR